jgi:predicted small lipoprotein YifL
MQTVKVILIILICCALLGACGLKGPLYLPEEDPATKPVTEQNTRPDLNDPDEKKKPDSD